LGRMSGGTSSSGSTSGRGLADMVGASPRLERFHRLLADTGVPRALMGERPLVGVERGCLAWMTRGCTDGTPGLPAPGVCTIGLDGCRVPVGVEA